MYTITREIYQLLVFWFGIFKISGYRNFPRFASIVNSFVELFVTELFFPSFGIVENLINIFYNYFFIFIAMDLSPSTFFSINFLTFIGIFEFFKEN